MALMLLAGAGGVTLSGSAATAQTAPEAATASPDQLRDTAQLVVSERLRTFALARGLAQGNAGIGTARDLRALLQAQGYYMEGTGLQLLEFEQGVYPNLAYVPNMNGGLENDTLILQGLVFRLRSDLVARGGAAFGLSYDGRVRVGPSQGHYVEAEAQLGVLHAPEPNLTRTVGQISVCSRNELVNWNFLDLCYNHVEVRRDLSDQTQDDLEMRYSHLFEIGESRHEVGFAVGRSKYKDLYQTHGTVSFDSVGRRIATRLSLDLSEPLQDSTGNDLSVRGEVRWLAAGHVVGLGLEASQSAQSTFFGERRQDYGLGVTALYQIKDNLVLSVGVSQTDSTVDFFDSNSVQFNISTKLN